MTTRWLSLLIANILFLSVVFSEDLVTLDGRAFRQIELSRLDGDRLSVRHEGGEIALFFYDVAEPIRKRLGFDTDAALKRLTLEVYQLQGKRDGSKVLSKSTPQPTNSARILLPLQLPTAPVLLPPLNPRDETTQTTRWNGLIPPALASKLSAVAPKETVSVWDLVNHYRSDPLAADTRYRKRAFLVTGVVERMEKGLLTRNVRVFLESPDPAVQPVCDWRIDDKIAAFYTRRDGRTLTVLEGRSKRTLLEAGDKVTFEVRGGGLSDGLIELQKALRQ